MLELLRDHPRIDKTTHFQAERLLGVCFSLWRAAFLADRTGKRTKIIEHAQEFLERMLVDNAITYPQDRVTREWTFNYYLRSARDSLFVLAEDFAQVSDAIDASTDDDADLTSPQLRWTKH
jgi:hypothetical protein